MPPRAAFAADVCHHYKNSARLRALFREFQG